MAESEQDRSMPECAVDLRRSSRSDLVAVLSALVTFPLAFWVCGLVPRVISPDIAANLALLFLSAVAATISAARARWDNIPPELQPASATRWGARIGTLVFLVGGGAFLLGGMACQINPAMTGEGVLGARFPSTGAKGIIFSMLPTIAVGSITCVLRLRSFSAEGLPAGAPVIREPKPTGGRAPVTVGVVFFALSLLSPGIPVLLAQRRIEAANQRMEENNRWLEEEKRRKETLAGTQSSPASMEQPILVDSFHYAPPEGFSEVPAARLKVISTRPVLGLSSGTVAEHSPDSTFLAFVDQRENTPTIFDLRKSKVSRKFRPLPEVAAMTWSPAGDRLFYLGKDNSCWVLDAASGASTPLPVRFPLAEFTPRWESDNEVQFYRAGSDFVKLDLTTLRVHGSRAAQSGSNRDSRSLTVGSLGETERFSLLIRPRLSTLASPLELASGSWSFGAVPAIFAYDKTSGGAFPLLNPPPDRNTSLLVSPDASMITVVTSDGADTHYIGVEDGAEQSILIPDVPPLPESERDSPLAEMIKAGKIGCFVCAPLVNPLNGKVIGADASRVRALGFFGGGGSDRLAITVTESYQPIRPSDVAGYLHQWQSREPVLLHGRGIEDWWSPVAAGTEAAASTLDHPGRWQDPYLEVTACGIQFRGWIDSNLRGPEAKTLNVADLGEAPADRPDDHRPPPVSEETVRRIQSFVKSHHAKVGRRDLEGFVNDYAGAVDLNDKGMVTPDDIRRDQAAYLPKYDNISETVLGDIVVVKNGEGWRAIYAMHSYALSKADGREFGNRVVIVLDIIATENGGLKITRERATRAN